SSANNYKLEERPSGGSWTQVYSDSGISKAISGKSNGTYEYRVRACNSGGCGSYSVIDSVQVLMGLAAPNLLIHSATSTGDYIVSWNTISGATRYRLEEKVNSGSWVEISHDDGDDVDHEFYSQPNATYSYRVRACSTSSVSTCGSYSQTKSITVTVAVPGVPTLSVPATSSTGSYTVSWNSVSSATTYKLEERPSGGSWTQIHSASGLSKAISGKGNGTYEYRVRACNSGGCGSYSAVDSVQVLMGLAAPNLLIHSATSTGDYIVSWNTIS